MINAINNFAGYNLSAILFAVFVLIVFVIMAKLLSDPFEKFILSPLYDYILMPLGKLFSISEDKKKVNETESKKSFFDKILMRFEQIFNFEKAIYSMSIWFSRYWLLKFIFLVFIPFFLLNYYLTAITFKSKFFDFNNEVIVDALGSFVGAVFVALVISLILKGLGTSIKKTISLSHIVVCSYGMIHFFI